MTVLRRCLAATTRQLTCSQPRPTSYSTPSFYNPFAVLSATTTLSLSFLAHRNTVSHSFLLPSLSSSHHSFHAAAYKPPHHHHHNHHSHPTHHTITHLTTPSTTATTTSLHSLFTRHFAFRKGRKGARTKLKSHSGSKKRFRFTRTGVIMRWRGGKSHKNWGTSSARLRRLSGPVAVYSGHVKMIRRSLPYGMKHSR